MERQQVSDRFVTMRAVLERVPLSKSEIYRRIKAGTFPSQIRIGAQRIAFLESEIDRWMADQRRSGPRQRNQ